MRRLLVRVPGSNCTTCAFHPRGAPSHVHRDAISSHAAKALGGQLACDDLHSMGNIEHNALTDVVDAPRGDGTRVGAVRLRCQPPSIFAPRDENTHRDRHEEKRRREGIYNGLVAQPVCKMVAQIAMARVYAATSVHICSRTSGSCVWKQSATSFEMAN